MSWSYQYPATDVVKPPEESPACLQEKNLYKTSGHINGRIVSELEKLTVNILTSTEDPPALANRLGVHINTIEEYKRRLGIYTMSVFYPAEDKSVND
jgi:hypothetical protein